MPKLVRKTIDPQAETTAITTNPLRRPEAIVRASTNSIRAVFGAIANLVQEGAPTPVVVAAYHLVTKEAEKLAKDVRAELRSRLIEMFESEEAAAHEEGDATEGVSAMLFDVGPDTFRLKKTQAFSKNPAADRVQELLQKKGRSFADGCDQVVEYRPNEEKLKNLVAKKVITQAELDACYPALSPRIEVEKI